MKKFELGLLSNGVFIENVLVRVAAGTEVAMPDGGKLIQLTLRQDGISKEGLPTIIYHQAWSKDDFPVGDHVVNLRVKGNPKKDDVKLWITKPTDEAAPKPTTPSTSTPATPVKGGKAGLV